MHNKMFSTGIPSLGVSRKNQNCYFKLECGYRDYWKYAEFNGAVPLKLERLRDANPAYKFNIFDFTKKRM